MTKRQLSPYMRDIENLIRVTVPFALLGGVGAGAVFSGGSWVHFFKVSLWDCLGLAGLIWFVMLVFYIYYRGRHGVFPHIELAEESDDLGVNPASGLPMINSTQDAAGNIYGTHK
jgi:hypothetical protein